MRRFCASRFDADDFGDDQVMGGGFLFPLIVFQGKFGEVLLGKLLHEELPAKKRFLGFLIGDAMLQRFRRQPRCLGLVRIAPGLGAEHAQSLLV